MKEKEEKERIQAEKEGRMTLGQILLKARKEKMEREKKEQEEQKEKGEGKMTLGQVLARAKEAQRKKKEEEARQMPSKNKTSPDLGSLLFQGIGNSMKKQKSTVSERSEQSDLGYGIKAFTKILKDEYNNEEHPNIQELKERMARVLKIDVVDERIKEREKLIKANETLLQRMEMAMKKKFIETKNQSYGFGNEDNLLPVLKQKCHESLEQKKKDEDSRQRKNMTLIGNFLMNKIHEQKKIQDMQIKVHKALADQFKLKKKLRLQNELEYEIRKKINASIRTYLKENLADRFKIQKIKEENEEAQKNDLFLKRAEGNCLYMSAHKVAESQWFEYFVNLAIVVNTAILALDQFPEREEIGQVIERSNLGFFALFFFEMLLKLVAYGFKGYFKDRFNCFDAFIVFISAIDILVNSFLVSDSQTGGRGAITALRAFRLLRVFKLAKTWEQLQNLLTTISKTLVSVTYFSILLFLLIFVYSILGMDIFAYKARFNDDDKLDLKEGGFPDSTFNNFLQAFLSVFIVLANDGWTTIYFNFYRAVNSITATLFFISLLFIGEYILLNLFLSILIDRFEEDSKNAEAKKIEQKMKKKALNKMNLFEYIREFFRKYCCQMFCQRIREDMQKRQLRKYRKSNPYDEQIDEEILTNPLNTNISLGIFKLDHPFRHLLRRFILPGSEELVDQMNRRQTRKNILERKTTNMDVNKASAEEVKKLQDLQEDPQDKEAIELMESPATFEYIILVLIMISSVQLALENPLNNPDGALAKILFAMDVILTSLFTLEAVAKIIAFGFIFNGKESYIRKIWNQVDFVIVIMSIVDLFLEVKISFFKVIRLFRVLRPLRVISRNEGLKISIQALIISIPSVFNVIMITFLFFLIFGIVGVNYLKGMYYRCENQEFSGEISDIFDCLNYGAMWKNFPANFDSTQNAILTLLSMANLVGWADIMYRGMASRGPTLEPIQNSQPYISLFYIFFMIVGCFFMINLFVGVVISTYNRERENLGKLFLLTQEQKKWLEAKMLVVRAQPLLAFVRPEGKHIIRRLSYDIVMNKYFDIFIMVCIFLNTVLLASSYFGEPEQFTQISERCNQIFLGVFTIEAILKLIAFKLRYFRDGWNTFDLLIVLGAYVGIVISIYSKVAVGPAATTIRAFRIARIIKLFRKNRKLAVVFKTFIMTLPAMANVGGLMILFVYIYAVLGVFLFAPIKHNGQISVHVNFENIGNAMLTLFRVATGENWHLVLAALYQRNSLDYQCIENPQYSDYLEAGKEPVGCGTTFVSIAYFASFILLVILIFLNLFIAIILSGFTDSSKEDSQVFNQEVKDHFRKKWSFFDPDATSFIKLSQLSEFLKRLGKPLGFSDLQYYIDNPQEEKDYIIQLIDLMGTYEPEEDSEEPRVNFIDVLECLTMQFILKEEFKRQIEAEKDKGATMIQMLMQNMKKAEEKETILNYEIDKLVAKKEKKEKNKNKRRNAFSGGSTATNKEVQRLSVGIINSPAKNANGRKTQPKQGKQSPVRLDPKPAENFTEESQKESYRIPNSIRFSQQDQTSSSSEESLNNRSNSSGLTTEVQERLGNRNYQMMNEIIEEKEEMSLTCQEISVKSEEKEEKKQHQYNQNSKRSSIQVQEEGSRRIETQNSDHFKKLERNDKSFVLPGMPTKTQFRKIMDVDVPFGDQDELSIRMQTE